MTYANLMVHLEIGKSNAGLLAVAGDLAERLGAGVKRLGAGVIGMAVCQPMLIVFDSGCYGAGDLIQQDRDEIAAAIKLTEAEFRQALESRIRTLDWRSEVTLGPLSECLACEARGADLVLTGLGSGGSFNQTRHINIGDLVMQLGRPVLVVPPSLDELPLERVVIGWKEAREPRRAIADALPLLKKAGHVAVVEIASKDDMAAARSHLKDVVGWLERHGVAAESLPTPSTGDDASQFNAIAREQGADLIVAGAYGHSRLREWAFGGITRDLLFNADRCALLSH